LKKQREIKEEKNQGPQANIATTKSRSWYGKKDVTISVCKNIPRTDKKMMEREEEEYNIDYIVRELEGWEDPDWPEIQNNYTEWGRQESESWPSNSGRNSICHITI
jgi:hypothetical protein